MFDGVLDNHFINTLEQKLEKTQVKRVDSDIVEKLIDKDTKLEHLLSNDEQEKIKSIFEKAINNSNMQLTVESLATDEIPIVITLSEFMRRMRDMAKMGGGYGFMGNMPDTYQVAINGNHNLISKILKEEKEEKQLELAKQVYDLALLSQNLLTGPSLTQFLKRSVNLVQ